MTRKTVEDLGSRAVPGNTDGGQMIEPNFRLTHAQLTLLIEGGLKKGKDRVGYATPAECAALAVLDCLENPATAPKEWRAWFERDQTLRLVIASKLNHRFGPRYSSGYDGPMPIGDDCIAAAEEILCALRWRGVLRDPPRASEPSPTAEGRLGNPENTTLSEVS